MRPTMPQSASVGLLHHARGVAALAIVALSAATGDLRAAPIEQVWSHDTTPFRATDIDENHPPLAVEGGDESGAMPKPTHIPGRGATPLIFEGLQHTPLGNADLTVDKGRILIVSNIGSSGQDGVSIHLGESHGLAFGTHWDQLPADGTMTLRYLGASGTELTSLRMDYGEALYVYEPQFAGSVTYSVTLLLDGVVVAIINDLSGPAIAHEAAGNGNKPKSKRKCKRKRGGCIAKCAKWTIDIGDPIDIFINGEDFLTDGFWVESSDQACDEAPSVLEILGSDLDSIMITDEYLDMFNGTYTDVLGDTIMDASNADLTITPAISGGTYGVRMAPGVGDAPWIDVPENFEAAWLPLDTAVDPGASMSFSATGRLGGVDDHEMGTLTITRHADQNGYWAELSADYSAVGSASQRVLIYDGDNLVTTVSGNTAAVIISCAPGRGDWIDVPQDCKKGLAIVDGQQTACYRPSWPQRVLFTFSNGQSFEGDSLAVLAEAPSAPVEGIESFSITLNGHAQLVLYNALFSDACRADLTNDGLLNFFDVAEFLSLYQAQDPIADFNLDGQLNFFDVSIYLDEYQAGCP